MRIRMSVGPGVGALRSRKAMPAILPISANWYARTQLSITSSSRLARGARLLEASDETGNGVGALLGDTRHQHRSGRRGYCASVGPATARSPLGEDWANAMRRGR